MSDILKAFKEAFEDNPWTDKNKDGPLTVEIKYNPEKKGVSLSFSEPITWIGFQEEDGTRFINDLIGAFKKVGVEIKLKDKPEEGWIT